MVIPSNLFIYIDIALVVLLICFIVIGYRKGLLFSVISLIYTIASIFVAWFLSPVFASLYPLIKLENLTTDINIILNFTNLEVVLNTIAYFAIIFLVLKVFYVLLAVILKGMNKVPVLGGFNKLLGGIVGAINYLIIVFMLSMLLSIPMIDNGKQVKQETFFKYVDSYSEVFLKYVVENVDMQHIKDEFNSFDVKIAREQFKEWLEYKKYE